MNILKVYDNWEKTKSASQTFFEVNQGHIKSVIARDLTYVLLNGTKVSFLPISSAVDARKVAGRRFSFIDVDSSSYFDQDTINFLMSRIRCMEMMEGVSD